MVNHNASSSSNHCCHVLLSIVAILLVKAVFILARIPSMTVWGDEMLYFMTAFDFLHLGEGGIPHPNFLNYPPVTSLFIVPIHWAGFTGQLAFQLSLIVLNGVHAIGVLAIYCLVREIFDVRSRFLVILLLVGPAATVGLRLMSEAPFIAFYSWLLYFYVRQLKTGQARYALGVGLLAGLMILTRKNGIGVLGSILVAMLAEMWQHRGDRAQLLMSMRLYLVSLAPAVSLAVLWKLAFVYGFEAKPGYYGPLGFIKAGFLPVLASIENLLIFSRKFLANLSYVTLSTYGICVPLVLWFCFSRGQSNEGFHRQRELVRSLMLHVSAFMLFSAFAAAIQMFLQRAHPNVRYLMYGRYMEYFAPVLVGVSLGLMAKRFRWQPVSRRWLIAIAVLISGAVSVIIPSRFFAASNSWSTNMSIAWLSDLSGQSKIASMVIGPTLALVLALVVTSRRFVDRRWPGSLAAAAVLALAVFNLSVSSSGVSESSRKFVAVHGKYSDFITRNPQLFEKGLFIDATSYANKKHHRERLPVHKALVDHLDKVIVGRHAVSRARIQPVLSHRDIEGAEVLFQVPGRALRIYRAKPKVKVKDG